MLRIFDYPNSRSSRREWLRVGGIGLGGLSLPMLAHPCPLSASESSSFGKAKSVIVMFLGGGTPQHDSWDPKPEAPEEIRGAYGTIPSKTPGLFVGELMPQTAMLTDKIAVLRAMVTNDNSHSSAGYQLMTGVPHVPQGVENAVSKAPNLSPNWGSIVKYLKQHERTGLPPAVTVPVHLANIGEIVWPGQIGGVLGPKYDPWVVKCDPSQPNFSIPDLALPESLSELRLERRLSLLDQVNRQLDHVAGSNAATGFDRQTQQALGLLSGSKARQAFDLTQETPETRERYGKSRWAQSVLLSRRLVEAGVSLVHINWCLVEGEPNYGSWDTHEQHNLMVKKLLMPWMDQAYSALLTDLADRGLLDETLVVWVGEMGHTPKINPRAGRDHWGHCFSLALAGGGVQGSVVHGKSDGHAAFPVSGVVDPSDLIATIFHCLGYSPETNLHDTLGRPIPISRGRVIQEVL